MPLNQNKPELPLWLGIHGFRPAWFCLIINVLANRDKFIELTDYCTVNTCAFIFRTKNVFGFFSKENKHYLRVSDVFSIFICLYSKNLLRKHIISDSMRVFLDSPSDWNFTQASNTIFTPAQPQVLFFPSSSLSQNCSLRPHHSSQYSNRFFCVVVNNLKWVRSKISPQNFKGLHRFFFVFFL